jgi:polysaccharide pyruvyl transferase WcaK-like protein
MDENMNYAVIGSALYGNKGASAMLETLIQGIGSLDEQAQFALLSLYPPQDTERNHFENLRIIPASPIALVLAIIPLCLLHRLFKPLRSWIVRRSQVVQELNQADVYVDQCGISFNDGRLKFLAYNIAVLLPGLLMQRPVVKVAQAMGPFESPINRLAARVFLPRIHRIFARGSITYSYIKPLGLANVSEGTDLALAFPSTRNLELVGSRPGQPKNSAGMRLVGVAPSAVAASKAAGVGINYIETLSSLIDAIAEKGHEVILFPHSARPDSEREHNNDLPLCRAIHADLQHLTSCRLIDREMSAGELRELIGSCRCLVTSRFHAMVGALAEGVPFLVVGWSHKYSELLSPFSLADQAIDYQNCQASELIGRFDEMLRNEQEIRSRISEWLPTARAIALEQIQFIHDTAAANHSGLLSLPK